MNKFQKTMLLLLTIGAGGSILKAEGDGNSHRLINSWEVSYGAGSPFGATEWRALKNSEFTQKFSQMWQVSLQHQFTADDYDAAPDQYYYPSIGAYLQWMDYSHLRMRGTGDPYPVSKGDDYGQIVSVGWTINQPFWSTGKMQAHMNLENGAAYVFEPHYDPVSNWVTLAQHWQVMVGLGVYLDVQLPHGLLSVGPQFTHLSNSGLGYYNTGINNFSLTMRYRHQTMPQLQRCPTSQALIRKDGTRFERHLYGSFLATIGGVYFERDEHPNRQLTFMADAMYRINPNNGLGVGIDFYQNAKADRTGHHNYVGAGIKYDHWFGPFVIHLQGGAYIGPRRPIKWKNLSRIYENIGFKYVMFRTRQVSPYLGIYTKGNGFNAEQMAFGLGVMIR